MTQQVAPIEMTVEDFIEAFRQRFGVQFVGKHATQLVNAIMTAMAHAETNGYVIITNKTTFEGAE